jgi:hypothetical protein
MAVLLNQLPVVNLFLNILTIIALTVLATTFWRRRQFWLSELHHLVEEMKEELPPVIAGEILARWDMERVDRRIERLENVTGWLESLQSEPSNVPPLD